jgi:hydrogenase/urease accessory protein HupE
MRFVVPLLALIWIATLCPLRAHDPFQSTVNVRFQHGQTEVTLILSEATVNVFIDSAEEIPVRPETLDLIRAQLLPQADQLFRITAGGVPLQLQRSRLGLGTGNEVELSLIYPAPNAEPIEAEALYFSKMDLRANGTLVVTDMGEFDERQLGSEIINRQQRSLTVSLEPPVATPQPATAPGPALSPPPPVPPSPAFLDFFRLGVFHILTGYDHLLFLCGLLLACRRLGLMLAIITAFTLAHSLTLALAALHLVNLPSRVVEPLIAATIVFVGIENLWLGEKAKGRAFVAGGFGLIHGFGFASALTEAGLGAGGQSIVVPLLAFNLGVETGQLTVAALFIPLLWLLRKNAFFQRHGLRLLSLAIVALGSWWLLDRLFPQTF